MYIVLVDEKEIQVKKKTAEHEIAVQSCLQPSKMSKNVQKQEGY